LPLLSLPTLLAGMLMAAAPTRADDGPPRAPRVNRAAATEQVYAAACAPCHGTEGDGNGPAAFSTAPNEAPRPRDFTKGIYKLRSTRSGAVPTDADLHRTISRGIPRYMPAFAALGDDTIAALVLRVKAYSDRFGPAPPSAVRLPEPPALGPDAATRGARVYGDLGCPACHGAEGRGNGPAAAALRDTTGLRIRPADLAHPSWFKGGSAPADVYRTLVTGMDGTPMPGYADVFVDLGAEKPWELIAYIASLSRERSQSPP
jgi:mono/diheme cytochrome c family protein